MHKPILFIFALVFAAQTSLAEDLKSIPQITVGITPTLGQLMDKIFVGYGSKHSVSVHFENQKSLPGISDCLMAEKCGLGLYPAAPGMKLNERLEKIHFSFGAVAFVTHSDVKVKNLSSDQLRKILSGEIKNWKEITGQDLPVVFIYGPFGPALARDFFQVAAIKGLPVDTGLEAMNRVRSTPGAITHGPLELVRKMSAGNRLSVPSLDGVAPSVESKDYLLRTQYVFLKSKSAKNPAIIDSMINYALDQRDRVFVKGEMSKD